MTGFDVTDLDVTDLDVTTARAQLAWLTVQDSAFPAGRFVHSHGLEAWLRANPDAGEADVVDVVRTAVTDSVAPLDAVFLVHAVRAAPHRLTALDQLLGTYKVTAAARVAARHTGHQLALVAAQVVPGVADLTYIEDVLAERTPGHQAVVEAVVHRHLGLGAELTVLGFLRGAMVGMLSAAVRLGRLRSLAAHRAVLRDHDLLADLARDALTSDLDTVWSCVTELDIHAMRHETATSRLFTT